MVGCGCAGAWGRGGAGGGGSLRCGAVQDGWRREGAELAGSCACTWGCLLACWLGQAAGVGKWHQYDSFAGSEDADDCAQLQQVGGCVLRLLSSTAGQAAETGKREDMERMAHQSRSHMEPSCGTCTQARHGQHAGVVLMRTESRACISV